jgi:DNA-binding transcriptional MerR regulator
MGGIVSGRSTELFRTCDVAQILGVTRRQLHYWARTGLVRPTHCTRGGHHRYTFRDLVAVRATKRLIDAGVSVQRIRRSAEALKKMLPAVEHPLAELQLVASGDVLLATREGNAAEATPSAPNSAAS